MNSLIIKYVKVLLLVLFVCFTSLDRKKDSLFYVWVEYSIEVPIQVKDTVQTTLMKTAKVEPFSSRVEAISCTGLYLRDSINSIEVNNLNSYDLDTFNVYFRFTSFSRPIVFNRWSIPGYSYVANILSDSIIMYSHLSNKEVCTWKDGSVYLSSNAVRVGDTVKCQTEIDGQVVVEKFLFIANGEYSLESSKHTYRCHLSR